MFRNTLPPFRIPALIRQGGTVTPTCNAQRACTTCNYTTLKASAPESAQREANGRPAHLKFPFLWASTLCPDSRPLSCQVRPVCLLALARISSALETGACPHQVRQQQNLLPHCPVVGTTICYVKIYRRNLPPGDPDLCINSQS